MNCWVALISRAKTAVQQKPMLRPLLYRRLWWLRLSRHCYHATTTLHYYHATTTVHHTTPPPNSVSSGAAFMHLAPPNNCRSLVPYWLLRQYIVSLVLWSNYSQSKLAAAAYSSAMMYFIRSSHCRGSLPKPRPGIIAFCGTFWRGRLHRKHVREHLTCGKKSGQIRQPLIQVRLD